MTQQFIILIPSGHSASVVQETLARLPYGTRITQIVYNQTESQRRQAEYEMRAVMKVAWAKTYQTTRRRDKFPFLGERVKVVLGGQES